MDRDAKVRRVAIPALTDARLERHASSKGVSVPDYIRAAIREAMDRDMFAEMDAENTASEDA